MINSMLSVLAFPALVNDLTNGLMRCNSFCKISIMVEFNPDKILFRRWSCLSKSVIKVNLRKCRFMVVVLWHQTADSMVHGTMKPKGVSASPSICKFLINLCCSQGCECKQTVICPDTLNKRFICIRIVG